jgi:hypothetical protein
LYFSDVTEGKLLDNMKTMLREEVTRYFDQLSGAAK